MEQSNQNPTIIDVPISEIDSFANHPYQVKDDEEMAQLQISIAEQGVLTPAIARQKENGRYELISGHRRMQASEMAGIATLPVIVKQLSDAEAAIMMCDSNLQREKILPSEKAYAYKMKMEALKKQGRRVDLTSTPVVSKSRSADEAGEINGNSREQVRRYIRLTELIPQLLKMVDEGTIAFRPAVEISCLPKKNQRVLFQAIERELATPSLTQALKMKSLAKDEELTAEAIASIMAERKPNQREQLRIPKENVARFFKKDETPEKMAEVIVKALELYRRREHTRDDAR